MPGTCSRAAQARNASQASNVNMLGMEGNKIVNRTYLVRRLLCLARALLSTSGGILFATVSCECTRKARVPGVLGTSRRTGGCAGEEKDGSGEECDMMIVLLLPQKL